MEGFINQFENENLIKFEIRDKFNYLNDLHNAVIRSISGRVGTEHSFNFQVEAQQLVANSIRQYELGYFDAAFYSLRAILELLMINVFFVEDNKNTTNENIKKWNNLEPWDTFTRMSNYLYENSDLYKNVKDCMSLYFTKLFELNKKLNKKVHKQGYGNFYTNRKKMYRFGKIDLNEEKKFFESALKDIIGSIIVFGWFLDPFPLLLMDKEIYSRTKDTMAGPLFETFTTKYIGNDYIELFKTTDIYKSYYDSIINSVKMYESVTDLIKYQLIDLSKSNEIEEQYNELSERDKLAFQLSSVSENIYAIEMYRGFHTYKVYGRIENKNYSIDFETYKKYMDLNESNYNISNHDDEFISILPDSSQQIFLFHSNELNSSEIKEIEILLNTFLTKENENNGHI